MRNILYRKFDSLRHFGVELEMSGNIGMIDVHDVIYKNSLFKTVLITPWRQSKNNNYWHVKTDSTCGSKEDQYGIEVASYKASGVEDMLHIADVAGCLKRYGAKVNRNCGLHVHVDIADFTTEQVGILVAHWLKFEVFLLRCVPSHRRNNEFCMPLLGWCIFELRGTYTAEDIWDIVCPVDISIHGDDRRVALNLVNYATGLRRKRWNRKTVELRLPEGTLDSVEVKNWIRFFVNFVEFCKNQPMPNNISPSIGVEGALQYMGLGHDDKCFNIYSEGLLETRLWLLKRCIKYGTKIWREKAKKVLKFIS